MEEMHAIGRKGRRGGSSVFLRVRRVLDSLTIGMSVSWRQFFVLMTILLAGITASLIVFIAVKGWEDERLASELQHDLGRVAANVTRSLDVDTAILESVAGLQAASGRMSLAEFKSMVSPAWSDHDAIQALAWVPRVPTEERADFQWRAHTEGFHGFSIHEQRRDAQEALPNVRREAAFPIFYIEPLRGNENLVGFDLASGHPYQAAMSAARDTGEAAATRMIEVGYADGPRKVIVILTPVYAKGGVPATVEQRRAKLSGFIAGIILVDEILNVAQTGFEGSLTLAVSDETEATPEGYREIYGQDSEFDLFTNVATATDPIRRLAGSTSIDVAGRGWQLRAVPTPEFLRARRGWQAEGLLVAGLQFSALLVAYLWQVFGRTAQVERLVDERTAELAKSNHELKREVIQRRAAERALTQGEERIRSIIHTVEVPLDLNTVETRQELQTATSALWGSDEGVDLSDEEFDEDFDLDGLDYDDQEALPLAGSARRNGDAVLTVVRDGDTDIAAGEEALGVMSRDMRSPVSSMIYAAKILARHRGLSPEKVAKFAGIVVDEGERLTNLINQALQVSNMEAVRGDSMAAVPVTVSELMDRITSVVETYAARKKVTLEINADPHLQPVMADENRVSQVLMTLVENGIRSTPARERVRVSIDQHNQNYVRFSVADSGPGLSVPEQENAFSAFSADTEVLKSHARDVGVGLAICREIVERHGGTIWVESRPGAGSVFSFTLPVIHKRQARAADRV